jgi:hypothetical protein
MVKRFQLQVWLVVIHYLSPCFGRGSGEIVFRVTVTWQVVHPEETLLLGIASISCHKDVISSAIPRIHSDCKVTAESMLTAKTDRERRMDAMLSPAFDLWGREGISAFQQRQFKHLLQLFIWSGHSPRYNK